MKFNFNAKFSESLNEILDSRFKTLKQHIQANYVHCDDLLCKEDIEDRLNELETVIEDSEIEHKVNIVDQDDLQDAFANSDLECRIDSLENENLSLESRIDSFEERLNDVEQIIKGSELEYKSSILERRSTDLEKRILTLEKENQELRERLLTLENFILKTLKGFKDD